MTSPCLSGLAVGLQPDARRFCSVSPALGLWSQTETALTAPSQVVP
jgi:hypothetical protein